MSAIVRLKECINYVFIFSTINDNFMVNHLGNMSLKIILVLFVFINIDKFLSFKSFSKQNRVFSCLIIMMLLSLIFNLSNYSEVIVAINLFLALGAIFVIFTQEKNVGKYIWCFVFSSLFSSLLCITATDTITEYTFRRTGGTGDPNEFSVTVLIPLGFLLGRIIKEKKGLGKMGIVAAILTYIIAMLYAGSKAAILTFILLFFFFITYMVIVYKSKRKMFLLISMIFIVVFVGFIVYNYYGETLQLLIRRFDENRTVNERLISWKAGIGLFEDNPFWGIGIANYGNMIGIKYPFIVESSRAAHNMYIQAFVELGFIGALMYIWFFFSPIYKQWKYRRYPIEIMMAFIPLVVMGGTLSLLLEKYVWVYLALLYNLNLFKQFKNI